MNWINKCKLSTTKAIKYEGQPYLILKNLWSALHATFNTMLHWQVNTEIFNELSLKPTIAWASFSKEEFR